MKLLVAAFNDDGRGYVFHGYRLGMEVRVLDFFSESHQPLKSAFGPRVFHVAGHRSEVTAAIREEEFDAVIIHEGGNFVRAALIAQAVHDAGVRKLIVVTPTITRRSVYRQYGASHVIIARSVNVALGYITKVHLLRPRTQKVSLSRFIGMLDRRPQSQWL